MNSPANNTEQAISEYLAQQSSLDLLRFITCGSVDDGKSTLIGRMLYEAQLIFDDQVASLKSDSSKHGTQGEDIDFALLVDGLAAEREQGITIDVAYRFFYTDRRKFIVADTPGHEEYTRNMVTGASTAEVAVILVDASLGLQVQTQRHSFITSLLGIRHVVLAVNKMDLVDFGQGVYDKLVADYQKFARQLSFETITAIPLSALKGDNVIERSTQTSWYSGPTLLGFLESVEVGAAQKDEPFRMPVQWVNRFSADFRGYAGTAASGEVKVGDEIRALPSGQLASVKSIVLGDQQLDSGAAGKSFTLTLDREIDLSRGDVICAGDSPCEVSDQFEVTLVWMNQDAGFVGRSYWLLLGSSKVHATITGIKFKYNINTMEQLSAHELALNDIAEVTIKLDRAIPYTLYEECKTLGAFVFVDRYNFATVAAGMINFSLRRASNIHHQALTVDRAAREELNGQKARVFWFTGLSGSGKSTVANAFEKALFKRGLRTYILDGDNVRHGLNKDLGFTDADRVENIRRVAEVAKLMLDAGLIVITAFISPFRSERDAARELFAKGDFVEVHVDTPLAVAEERDPKGLYKKARRGELPNFTGIDSAYEEPTKAELHLRTDELSVEQSVQNLLDYLDDQ